MTVQKWGEAEAALRRDYESLGERLARRGVEIEALVQRAAGFGMVRERPRKAATMAPSSVVTLMS